MQGGSDDKRHAPDDGACRGSLQGCGGEYNLSEKTAVGGDQLRCTRVCGYFRRTDFARNMLGIVTIVTFGIHWYIIYIFQVAISRYRRRVNWVYQTYFTQEERVGLNLPQEPTSYWEQWEVATGLVLVSLVGAVFTAIYLWSVRT